MRLLLTGLVLLAALVPLAPVVLLTLAFIAWAFVTPVLRAIQLATAAPVVAPLRNLNRTTPLRGPPSTFAPF